MPTAFVVDDNRLSADSFAQCLSLLNYEARVLLGPLPAIEALSGRLPEVVFLDIHMQGMDGVEVCHYIRRDPRLAGLPIIGISSDTQPVLVEQVRLAGANGFLSKPIEFEALEGVLRAVARLNAARRQPSGASLGLARQVALR